MKIFFLLICVFLLNSCSVNHTSDSNKICLSFSLEEKELIEWEMLLKQDNEIYYVYIYSETCGYCKKTEPEITKLRFSAKVYFVLFNENIALTSERGDLIGAENIEDLYVLGIPTLFLIDKSKVKACYIGFNEIVEHIKEVT